MLKRLQQIPRIQWVACRTVPVTGARAVHGRWHTIPVATRWHVLPIPLHVGDRQAPETYRFRCNQGQKGSVMHRFRGLMGKWNAKKYQVPPRFPRLRGCTRPIVNSWVKFFPWGTGEGVPFWACQAKSTCGHSTGGIYFWSVSASSGLHPIPSMSSKIDTRPIVNSWVKFFPWGTGEGVPFWACQAKSTCGHSTGGIYFWSVSASSGLHPIPSMSSKIDTRPFHGGGTYRPRRRAYPSGGQL